MKNTVLALLAVMLLSSCSKKRDPQTYDNPKIGLRMTYPGTWKAMKKEALNDAIAQAREKVTVLSPESFDVCQEVAPHIILTLIKPQKVDGVHRNPSINVLVLEIPKAEWGDVDMDSMVQEQIEEITLSGIAGAEVTINDFPLPDYPAIHNYSVRVPLPGRTVTVYQYAYWHPPYFVQLGFTLSHPDAEQELKAIITSMKIKTPKTSAGGGK